MIRYRERTGSKINPRSWTEEAKFTLGKSKAKVVRVNLSNLVRRRLEESVDVGVTLVCQSDDTW